jgi:hypothetical protein
MGDGLGQARFSSFGGEWNYGGSARQDKFHACAYSGGDIQKHQIVA